MLRIHIILYFSICCVSVAIKEDLFYVRLMINYKVTKHIIYAEGGYPKPTQGLLTFIYYD